MTPQKRCTVCLIEKPITGFNNQPRGILGVMGQCQPCYRERQKATRLADPKKYKEQQRAAYFRRKEKHLAESRRWNSENAERNAELRRARYLRYKESGLHAQHSRNRRAREMGAEGFHTAEDVRRIRIEQGDRCAACRTDLNGKGELDHIEPLARGGSNWPENLQWLCAPCNRRKHTKSMAEFLAAAT